MGFLKEEYHNDLMKLNNWLVVGLWNRY